MTQVITFKSIPSSWIKERIGIKNNTVRRIEKGDYRRGFIDAWIKEPFDLWIAIENTTTKDYFKNYIKDVTRFEDLYIITW